MSAPSAGAFDSGTPMRRSVRLLGVLLGDHPLRQGELATKLGRNVVPVGQGLVVVEVLIQTLVVTGVVQDLERIADMSDGREFALLAKRIQRSIEQDLDSL